MPRDRGGRFTDAFDHVLAGAGIEVVKTLPQCPPANAYAYAERWIRTLRTELTNGCRSSASAVCTGSRPNTCATTTSTAPSAVLTWHHRARPPRSSTSPSGGEYAANPSSAG
ncbi:hypothetical protein [Actinospica sp.]|uniref:hypothetical protein n=1 Tax=Actinospica sp. TaxID=1872142 RepID=UPI002C101A68|nr:hypothetical protein [Actinospica sp.]HWG22478.1 hypothetical protein [Actinospica sp.]